MALSVMVEMENGAIVSYDSTILNFNDGYTASVDFFDPGPDITNAQQVAEYGLRVHRKAYKKTSPELVDLETPRILVSPEDIESVRSVSVNGILLLETDGYGNLVPPGRLTIEDGEDKIEVQNVLTGRGKAVLVDENGEIYDSEEAREIEDIMLDQAQDDSDFEPDELMDDEGYSEEDALEDDGFIDDYVEEKHWSDDEDYSG